MADVRISQLVTETATSGDADVRISQLIAETATRGAAVVRVSQLLVETVALVVVDSPPSGPSRPGYPLWQSGPIFGGGAGA